MAYLVTAADLKADALFLAGEPQDGTSDYDSRVYEWLTVVQRTVVSGGMLGPVSIMPADWWWARAWPRGVIQLVQPYNAGETITATFGTGSTVVQVVTSSIPDLTGYRVLRADTPARHVIDQVQNGIGISAIILREPWTGDNLSDSAWLAYPDTYELPEDFVRGLSPLFLYAFPSNIPTTTCIDVIEATDLERFYPQTFPWGGNTNATVTGSGMPVLAARVTDTRLRFSHFLNTPDTPLPAQVEFEYIRRPPVLAEGVVPMVPIEHRRVLSYGCAALITTDKGDASSAVLWQATEAHFRAMKDDHARDMRRMSSRWGVIQPPRSSGNRAILLTETGLPVYVW